MPQIGTVIRRTKNFYYVDIGESEPRLCHIRANLFHGKPKTNLVSVGDQVEIDTADVGKAGWILKMMERLCKGDAKVDDIDKLNDVCSQVENHTICALGDAAAWPIQGLLRHFRPEVEKRIHQAQKNKAVA